MRRMTGLCIHALLQSSQTVEQLSKDVQLSLPSKNMHSPHKDTFSLPKIYTQMVTHRPFIHNFILFLFLLEYPLLQQPVKSTINIMYLLVL